MVSYSISTVFPFIFGIYRSYPIFLKVHDSYKNSFFHCSSDISRRKILAVTGPMPLNSWSLWFNSSSLFADRIMFVMVPYDSVNFLQIERSFVAVEKSYR